MENNPLENTRPEEEPKTEPTEQTSPQSEKEPEPKQENRSSANGSYTDPGYQTQNTGANGNGQAQNQYYYGQQGPNPGWYAPQQSPTVKKSSGAAAAALILGLLSLFGVCCCAIPAVIFGLAGFITALVAAKKQGFMRGAALAGLILSLIGFALGIAGVMLGSVIVYAAGRYGYRSDMTPEEFIKFIQQFADERLFPRF